MKIKPSFPVITLIVVLYVAGPLGSEHKQRSPSPQSRPDYLLSDYRVFDGVDIFAGPLGYKEGYWHQDVTSFYLIRARVGFFHWFPGAVILGSGMDTLSVRVCLGQDVFIRGRYADIPIHPPEPLMISSISGILAEDIVAVENREQEVFEFSGLPDTLDRPDLSVRFTAKNVLEHDLEEARLIMDLQGSFQFKDGRRDAYTSHHKEWRPQFKGLEKMEFACELMLADTLHEKDRKMLAISVMFIGYARRGDEIEPVYALWKRQWQTGHFGVNQ
jgi:hypothetical protein